MRQLRYLTPSPTEEQLHRVVSELLDWCLLPPALWTTFPAGWGKLPRATAGRLYACGLKPGLPDIFVFYDGRTIGIELKRVGGKPTKIQQDMHQKLRAAGIMVHLCCSAQDVVLTLKAEGFPLRKMRTEGLVTSVGDSVNTSL